MRYSILVLLTSVVLIAGCTESLTGTIGSMITKNEISSIFSISANSIVLAVGESFDLSTIVNGGVGTITYEVPITAGTINGSIYLASDTPGTYKAHIRDSQLPSSNEGTITIIVNPGLTLTPSSTTMLVGSQQVVYASGGVPPYIYSVSSGLGSIDNGLFTAPFISGTVELLVTDSHNKIASAQIIIQENLNITNPNPAPEVLTEITQPSVIVTGGTQASTPAEPIVSTVVVEPVLSPSPTPLPAPVSALPIVTITSPTANSTIVGLLTVSGTCTEAGQAVNLSITSSIMATTVCSGGVYSSSLDMSTLPEGSVTITAAHSSSTGVIANPVTVRIFKGSRVPDPPTAIKLSDPTTSPNRDTTPTLLIEGLSLGDTVSIFVDASCGGAYLKGSSMVSVGTTATVTSSVLIPFAYTFYAKTVTAEGKESTCSSSANVKVDYTLDLTPPGLPTISINAGAAYISTLVVPLTLASEGATHMYVTNTPGCSAGGSYVPYSPGINNWFLVAENSTNTVYAKFKNLAGNETACVSDSIIHDTLGPAAPTGLSLGTVPPSKTTTPPFAWTAAADNVGGSGIGSYKAQIHLASDDSIIVPWTTLSSGAAITETSDILLNETQYYMKVRAVDNAGNIGEEAKSGNWTATTAVTYINVNMWLGSTIGTTLSNSAGDNCQPSKASTLSTVALREAAAKKFCKIRGHGYNFKTYSCDLIWGTSNVNNNIQSPYHTFSMARLSSTLDNSTYTWTGSSGSAYYAMMNIITCP